MRVSIHVLVVAGKKEHGTVSMLYGALSAIEPGRESKIDSEHIRIPSYATLVLKNLPVSCKIVYLELSHINGKNPLRD